MNCQIKEISLLGYPTNQTMKFSLYYMRTTSNILAGENKSITVTHLCHNHFV